MTHSRALIFSLILLPGLSLRAEPERPATFCNPMDLPYRFQLEPAVRREAADPTLVVFKNEYWLFASKSGGYWHSPDGLHWIFVESKTLPIENYAPTAEVVNGRLLWATGGHGIWTNDDPSRDTWVQISKSGIPGDPALFYSKAGRLYVYGGCSDKAPITGVGLDLKTFQSIGDPVPCVSGDMQNRGWETLKENGRPPFIEGSWMTEHAGTFYLQYAAPGTEVDGYGDGVFTAKDPLGPFTYAPYSPFSFKPTGFIRSAGHGSTFQDLAGNWWHIATMLVGERASFERRVGLFPAGFTSGGELFCDTYLGDYPHFPPGTASGPKPATPGWMLLSYRKAAKASSELEKHPVEMAFDENIHDWWSAKTGDKGEWLEVDLGKLCRIEAVQTNFMDQDAQIFGRLQGDAYQYVIEVSSDGVEWKLCIDKSRNEVDSPHDYVQLPAPVQARYVRLTNLHCPAGAKLSVSGFRIFGNGLGEAPARVQGIKATRDAADARRATISWPPSKGAEFYIIRYGLTSGTLFANQQIYEGQEFTLKTLNASTSYVATVDAVNDSGITKGTETVTIP